MQSAGFSDINYRRRMISNSRQPSIVGSNPYGDYKVTNSFDSLEKQALANNPTVNPNGSYDIYGGQNGNHTTLGSHLSPGNQQFADLHEVHYAPGGNNNVNATVHIPPTNYEGFENRAYRPETRQSQMQQEDSQASLWQNNAQNMDRLSINAGPPGYTSNVALDKSRSGDSVLDFKRDLAEKLAREEQDDSTNTSETQTTEATDQEYQMMDQEYQTMDKDRDGVYGHSTFRPPSQNNYSSNTNTQTLQMRQPQFQQPLPTSMHNADTIPSVPGYAKPFAHQNGLQPQSQTTEAIASHRGTHNRPYNPPPEPPHQRPKSAMVTSSHQSILDLPPAPSEPTFDEPLSSLPPAPYGHASHSKPQEDGSNETPSRMLRTKSMGEILETNFDDDSDSQPILAKQSNAHSRSMQLLHSGKLTMNGNLLETDM